MGIEMTTAVIAQQSCPGDKPAVVSICVPGVKSLGQICSVAAGAGELAVKGLSLLLFAIEHIFLPVDDSEDIFGVHFFKERHAGKTSTRGAASQ